MMVIAPPKDIDQAAGRTATASRPTMVAKPAAAG